MLNCYTVWPKAKHSRGESPSRELRTAGKTKSERNEVFGIGHPSRGGFTQNVVNCSCRTNWHKGQLVQEEQMIEECNYGTKHYAGGFLIIILKILSTYTMITIIRRKHPNIQGKRRGKQQNLAKPHQIWLPCSQVVHLPTNFSGTSCGSRSPSGYMDGVISFLFSCIIVVILSIILYNSNHCILSIFHYPV